MDLHAEQSAPRHTERFCVSFFVSSIQGIIMLYLFHFSGEYFLAESLSPQSHGAMLICMADLEVFK